MNSEQYRQLMLVLQLIRNIRTDFEMGYDKAVHMKLDSAEELLTGIVNDSEAQ